MSDTADVYRAMKAYRQEQASESRDLSAKLFAEASRLAKEGGMSLTRRSDAHYQLRHAQDGWLLNLYPGNGRVYGDRNKPRGPFLHLPDGWTVIDAVESAKGGTR